MGKHMPWRHLCVRPGRFRVRYLALAIKGDYFLGSRDAGFVITLNRDWSGRSLVTEELITMRCRLNVFTFAILIVPAFASEAACHDGRYSQHHV